MRARARSRHSGVRPLALSLSALLALSPFSGLLEWSSSVLAQEPAGADAEAGDRIRLYDVLYLTRGRRIEGTILTEGALDSLVEVEFQMKPRGSSGSARVTIPRAEIVRAVRRRSASDVYALKLEKVEALRDPGQRSLAEAELADWCRTPLLVLDGKPPRPDAALAHYFAAVELDPTIHRVYPWIISLLSASGPLEAADAGRLEKEARLMELAAEGHWENPELEYRRGLLCTMRLGQPDLGLPHLEKVIRSDYANRAHMRRARSMVARTFRDRGELEKARDVYVSIVREPPTDPQNFEPFFELGRLAMEEATPESRASAREYFTKAQAIQPEYWPLLGYLAALDLADDAAAAAGRKLETYVRHDPDASVASADLALVQTLDGELAAGTKRARDLVTVADEKVKARAHVILGKVLDDKGDLAGAIAELRRALELRPDSVAARLQLASALIRFERPEEASEILAPVLAGHGDRRGVVVACSRLLADAELQRGRDHEARMLLQRAARLEPADIVLSERFGILLMRQGSSGEASRLLEEVRRHDSERPATLAALGYYHYGRQEFEEARECFDAVVRLTRPVGGKAESDPHRAELRAYALRGRSLIDDLRQLEVWKADFSGGDAPRVDGWEEVERFGVEISRQDGAMLFSGTQRGDPEGVTLALLERSVESASFERVVLGARVRSGRVRLALRLEGESARGAKAGLLLYRDYDGLLGVMVKGTRSVWEALKPVESEATPGAPGRGSLEFPGDVRWPEGDAEHTLEIRKSPSATSSRSARGDEFDLYFDGRPVAKNVPVPGLRGGLLRFGVSTQTDREGNSYSVSVHRLEAYRERRVSGRGRRR